LPHIVRLRHAEFKRTFGYWKSNKSLETDLSSWKRPSGSYICIIVEACGAVLSKCSYTKKYFVVVTHYTPDSCLLLLSWQSQSIIWPNKMWESEISYCWQCCKLILSPKHLSYTWLYGEFKRTGIPRVILSSGLNARAVIRYDWICHE